MIDLMSVRFGMIDPRLSGGWRTRRKILAGYSHGAGVHNTLLRQSFGFGAGQIGFAEFKLARRATNAARKTGTMIRICG